jgi:cytochrome c oxidase subunit 2
MWTVIPVLILVVIAVPSFRLLYYLDKQIEPDMTIKVTGIQWYWNYEYPDQNVAFDSYMISEEDLKPGQKRLLDVDNPLVLPEGSKVKVLIAGNDVMHSFFVPSLAVQVYSIAGRINEVWTEIPIGPKKYYGQCNQICGVNHAYMPIVLKSVSKDDYKEWLADAKLKFANVDSNIKVVMNNEKNN